MTHRPPYRGLTFDCTIVDGIACVHLKRGAFILGTDLDEKKHLFDMFEGLGQSDEVKAVLVFNTPEAFAEQEHQHFVESLKNLQASARLEATTLLERQDNALTQYALLAVRYKKLLVSCLVGEIATPFFGLSLISDLRLVLPTTCFCLSHVALGVPPAGGLGFLLPQYVGQGYAAQYLLTGGRIPAERAEELGLIQAILARDTFEQDCISWVQQVLASGTAHLAATRQLMYRNVDAFEAYLQEESKLRLRLLHHS